MTQLFEQNRMSVLDVANQYAIRSVVFFCMSLIFSCIFHWVFNGFLSDLFHLHLTFKQSFGLVFIYLLFFGK